MDDDPLHTVFCTPKLFELYTHELPDVSMFEPMFPVSVTVMPLAVVAVVVPGFIDPKFMAVLLVTNAQ